MWTKQQIEKVSFNFKLLDKLLLLFYLTSTSKWTANEQDLIILYCVFILIAMSPYTTGLKALLNPSDCTGTDPTHN